MKRLSDAFLNFDAYAPPPPPPPPPPPHHHHLHHRHLIYAGLKKIICIMNDFVLLA